VGKKEGGDEKKNPSARISSGGGQYSPWVNLQVSEEVERTKAGKKKQISELIGIGIGRSRRPTAQGKKTTGENATGEIEG